MRGLTKIRVTVLTTGASNGSERNIELDRRDSGRQRLTTRLSALE
jgi:hypothetical protein